jgi:hypothetical protein
MIGLMVKKSAIYLDFSEFFIYGLNSQISPIFYGKTDPFSPKLLKFQGIE